MIVTLIAVGNCGYNIANDIIEAGIITPANYIICDTDVEELQNKKPGHKCKTVCLQEFEGNPHSGLIHLVSGMIPEETDIVLLCAGMGGEAGSRYAPLTGMAAHTLNKLVISVFATAFRFEGEKAQTRSKWGFLQQQIASDFCIYQDNNCLSNDLFAKEMNKPLINALKTLKKKFPLCEWPELSTTDLKNVTIETARNSSPTMVHNFYSKKYVDIDSREKIFNEIIAINS